MTVNISGQVPGEQQNGLVAIESELLHERTPDPITAVVVIERASLKYNDVKQEWSATIRFRHIEPLENEEDWRSARALMEKAYVDRTGQAYLEQELDIPDEPLDEPDLDLDSELAEGEGSFEPEPEVPAKLKAVK